MADDTREIIEPLFENDPLACPKNMLPYEQNVLLPEQQRAVNAMKVPTIRDNQQYLAAHPEVNAIVTLLLRAVIAQRPKNIPEFLGDFMAREEVEDEIKKYLHDELHTDIARGVVEPERTESKRYRLLDEDMDNEPESEVAPEEPEAPEVASQDQPPEDPENPLKTSISESIDNDKDRYRMSVLSGDILGNMPVLSKTLLAKVCEEPSAMQTLMAPRTGSSTHTDSLGTCSLLDDIMEPAVARSVSVSGHSPLLNLHEIKFSRPHDDADASSFSGNQSNDEMTNRSPKRNISGVSAISMDGVFMAVETKDILAEGGGEKHETKESDSQRGSGEDKRSSQQQGNEEVTKQTSHEEQTTTEEEDKFAQTF